MAKKGEKTPAKKPVQTGKADDVEIVPLTPKETKEVETVVATVLTQQDKPINLSRGQMALLKRTVAKGSSDDELMLFLNICRGAQLNPFLHQAHFVPFWDSKAGEERRAIIVGIDGFRSIAESSGNYAGNDDPAFQGEEDMEVEVWQGKDKVKKKISYPKQATVTVYKIVGGLRNAFTATARWSEYYPGEKKGNQWHKMPYLMLGKCAEALALRKAFPKLLGGLYAQEEMDQARQTESGELAAPKGAFDKLMAAIGTSDLQTLKDYKAKIEKSDKYTAAQKKKFLEAVEPRIAELENNPA